VDGSGTYCLALLRHCRVYLGVDVQVGVGAVPPPRSASRLSAETDPDVATSYATISAAHALGRRSSTPHGTDLIAAGRVDMSRNARPPTVMCHPAAASCDLVSVTSQHRHTSDDGTGVDNVVESKDKLVGVGESPAQTKKQGRRSSRTRRDDSSIQTSTFLRPQIRRFQTVVLKHRIDPLVNGPPSASPRDPSASKPWLVRSASYETDDSFGEARAGLPLDATPRCRS
jgi:hypothetical protein